MTRGCTVPNCQQTPAAKSKCCGQRLCDFHAATSAAHSCPTQARLLAMTPADVKRWKLEHAPEEGMTPDVVDALNAMPEIELAWQSRKRGGVRANDAARAVADVTAVAKGGLHVEVELKRDHKDGCPCESCAAQRDRALRIRGAGGVYVEGVRTVQAAVDGVRMGLAKARGRERSTG